MCRSGAVDTIEHLLFDCDMNQSLQMIQKIKRSLYAAGAGFVVDCMNAMSRRDLLLIVLGYTFTDRSDERRLARYLKERDVYAAIDINVKHFLMVTFKRRDRAVCGGTRTAMFASLREPEPDLNPDRESQPIATLHDDDTDPESDDDVDIDSAQLSAIATADVNVDQSKRVRSAAEPRTLRTHVQNPLSLVNSPPSLLAEPIGSLLSERAIKSHSPPLPRDRTRRSICASVPVTSDSVDLCVPFAPTLQCLCQPFVECVCAPANSVCCGSGLSVSMPRSQAGRSRISAVNLMR